MCPFRYGFHNPGRITAGPRGGIGRPSPAFGRDETIRRASGIRNMQTLLAFFFIIIIVFVAIVLVIAAVGASFVLSAIRILFSPFRKRNKQRDVVIGADGQPLTDVMVKDPVCGTYLPKGDAVRETVGGRTLYFCSRECLSEYKKRS
jgi:YHS domain-containing protein